MSANGDAIDINATKRKRARKLAQCKCGAMFLARGRRKFCSPCTADDFDERKRNYERARKRTKQLT